MMITNILFTDLFLVQIFDLIEYIYVLYSLVAQNKVIVRYNNLCVPHHLYFPKILIYLI